MALVSDEAGTEGMQELLLPWAAFLEVAGPHQVCTKLHLNDMVPIPFHYRSTASGSFSPLPWG